MTSPEQETGRQKLIDAAVELFAERGYEATSIVEIATRSGVSRGSVPWHFGNKAGLLAAVVDQEIDRLLAAFGAQAPATVESAVTALTEFTRQPSTGLFVSLLTESLQPDSPIRPLHAGLHRRIIEAAEHWIEQMAPGPLDTESRRQQAALMVAAVIGVQQQWRIAPELIDVAGAYRQLLRALLRPSGARNDDEVGDGF